MKQQIVLDTAIGELGIITEDGCVTEISFGRKKDIPCGSPDKTALQAVQRLTEYFSGKRTVFDIPMKINGSDFQKTVWRELLKIHYGTTVTYGEIARRIGRPGASRAVGMACNRNRIPILIPCHRVIGKDGNLTGFSDGLDIKRFLLEMENATLFS